MNRCFRLPLYVNSQKNPAVISCLFPFLLFCLFIEFKRHLVPRHRRRTTTTKGLYSEVFMTHVEYKPITVSVWQNSLKINCFVPPFYFARNDKHWKRKAWILNFENKIRRIKTAFVHSSVVSSPIGSLQASWWGVYTFIDRHRPLEVFSSAISNNASSSKIGIFSQFTTLKYFEFFFFFSQFRIFR